MWLFQQLWLSVKVIHERKLMHHHDHAWLAMTNTVKELEEAVGVSGLYDYWLLSFFRTFKPPNCIHVFSDDEFSKLLARWMKNSQVVKCEIHGKLTSYHWFCTGWNKLKKLKYLYRMHQNQVLGENTWRREGRLHNLRCRLQVFCSRFYRASIWNLMFRYLIRAESNEDYQLKLIQASK